MYNPFVDKLDSLSDIELDKKINDLSRKYFLTHNPQVQQQMSVILEMYKEEARARRARQQLNKDQDNGDNSLDNLIKIS